jgi:hypothetical protein
MEAHPNREEKQKIKHEGTKTRRNPKQNKPQGTEKNF